jgi:Mrp family chromosome partitioning ATPase
MPGLTEALTEHAGSSVPSDELPVPAPSVLKPSPRAIAPSDSASPAISGASCPSWASSVLSTKIPNLSLLPRGQPTHRSSELFLSSLAVRFLEQTANTYDFVIVDTAPVMAADDVTSLAPHVDGVIFVVRAEHSSARVARAALDLLYLRHVRILGLVFNAVRPSSADYYYYYKYKDYYGSYPAA